MAFPAWAPRSILPRPGRLGIVRRGWGSVWTACPNADIAFARAVNSTERSGSLIAFPSASVSQHAATRDEVRLGALKP